MLLADGDHAGAGASAAASRLNAGRVRDQRRRRCIARSRRSSAQVGPQAAPRIGEVVGVDEQARQPRRAAPPPLPSRWSSTRRHLHAVGEREERLVACAAPRSRPRRRGRSPPAPAARLIAARTVPPIPQACRSRMRTSRPSGFALRRPRDRAGERQRQPVREQRGRRRAARRASLGLASSATGAAASAPPRSRAHRDVVLDRVVRPQAPPANLSGRVLGRLAAVGDAVEVGPEPVRAARRPRAAGSRRRSACRAGRARRGRGARRSARPRAARRTATSIASPRRRASRKAGPAPASTVPSTCSVVPSTRMRVTSACGASGLASTVSGPPSARTTAKR